MYDDYQQRNSSSRSLQSSRECLFPYPITINYSFSLDHPWGIPIFGRYKYRDHNPITYTRCNCSEIHKQPNDYNLHLEELIEQDKTENQPKFEGIAKFDEPRIDDGKLNKNLVLQFAKVDITSANNCTYIAIVCFTSQEMSSIPEHGFKLDNYSQLLSDSVLNTLTQIISRPMTWFGGAALHPNETMPWLQLHYQFDLTLQKEKSKHRAKIRGILFTD